MFRKLNEAVSVAGQIAPEDVAGAAQAGFVAIVNNRPDGEAPDQPAGDAVAAAAREAGLAYHAIPIGHDGFPEASVAKMADVLEEAQGPVLAFCRSGTRSTFLWALARARLGEDGAALAEAAARAGYDLGPIRGWLEG